MPLVYYFILEAIAVGLFSLLIALVSTMWVKMLLVVGVVLFCFGFNFELLYKPVKNFDVADDSRAPIKELSHYQFRVKQLMQTVKAQNSELVMATYKSEHDALTGLYNRMRLERYKYAGQVFVIYFDINNLKLMNDTYGHEAGDAIIKKFAAELNYWYNYGDVYRMGGDEFMVVIQNQELDICTDLFRAWFDNLPSLNRVSDGFKCDIAYGFDFGDSFAEVMRRSDDLMYENKAKLKGHKGR